MNSLSSYHFTIRLDEVVGGGGSKDGMGYKKRKGFNLEVKPFSNL
jgi:hypothetical protein